MGSGRRQLMDNGIDDWLKEWPSLLMAVHAYKTEKNSNDADARIVMFRNGVNIQNSL